MLIVCTAWVADESCDGFNAMIPPAGAILARVRSLRPPASVLLVPAVGIGEEAAGVVVTMEVVGVVVVETVSWIWTDCHSPDAVLKRI